LSYAPLPSQVHHAIYRSRLALLAANRFAPRYTDK